MGVLMLRFLLIFIFAILMSCTACNSKSQNHDSQDSPDLHDSNKDTETIDKVPDLSDEALAESDEIPDEEHDDDWPPKDDKELPDLDKDPYVTHYPDYDRHIAYEYYGDFKVDVKDPDNVRKLWDKRASGPMMFECDPMPFDLCAENYPFEPQIIDGPFPPFNKEYYEKMPQITYPCDALLTPKHWVTSNLSNEKIFHGKGNLFSYYLSNATGLWQSTGVYLYDIDEKQVTRISRDLPSYGFNKDSMFLSSFDMSIDVLHPDGLYYGERFLYPLYYNFKEHRYGHMWKMDDPRPISNLVDLRASDTHVFMTVYFGPGETGNDAAIMYTKIGEWDKWKELTYKKNVLYGLDRRAGYPDMLNNFVVYYDYDFEVQYCDLEKGDAGCFKISRDGEYGRGPVFFEDHKTVLYVSEDKVSRVFSFIKAEVSESRKITYTEVYKDPEVVGSAIIQANDEHIFFLRRPAPAGKGMHCWYRFSDKKTFCMDGEFDLGLDKKYAYSYNRTYIYNTDRVIAVRDMECYCDHNPDNCPFADYTPNPENPKEAWKRPFKVE
jgi:hypothetical protein